MVELNGSARYYLDKNNTLENDIINEIIPIPKYMRDILENKEGQMLIWNFMTENYNDMTPYRTKLMNMMGTTYMMGDNMESLLKKRYGVVKSYRLMKGSTYVSRGIIKISE